MVAAQAVSRKRGFIEESILELAARPQISELKIVAYSAGGVLTVVSVSDIEDVVPVVSRHGVMLRPVAPG